MSDEWAVAGEKTQRPSPVGASALVLVSRRFDDHGVASCEHSAHAAVSVWAGYWSDVTENSSWQEDLMVPRQWVWEVWMGRGLKCCQQLGCIQIEKIPFKTSRNRAGSS